MKSGSLRRMPTPPIISTDCGTSRSIEIFCPSPCGLATGTGGEIALGRQAAEHLVDQLAGGRSIDVADDADLERVAGEHLPHVILEIGRRDGRNRLQGAARRPAIGMAGKGGRPPAPAGHLVGARGRAAQPGEHLVADALDIDRVETRRREGQPQQLERLILIVGQRAQRARRLVAGGSEADLDRLGFDPFVEALGIDARRRPRRAAPPSWWRRPACRRDPGWRRP